MDMIVNSQHIVELRKSKAWSQQHLADVSGLSLRTVQRIENSGSGAPDSIKAIAMAFGLIPSDLMSPKVSGQNIEPQSTTPANTVISRRSLSVYSSIFAALLISISVWLATGWNGNASTPLGSSEPVKSINNSVEGALVTESVLSWLKLVDGGEYEASWQQSDPVVHAQVSEKQWQQAVQPVRSPLGNAISRELLSLELLSSMAGLPDGEYAIVTMNTRFKNKATSVETIPMSKATGQWRPIGYFIR